MLRNYVLLVVLVVIGFASGVWAQDAGPRARELSARVDSARSPTATVARTV